MELGGGRVGAGGPLADGEGETNRKIGVPGWKAPRPADPTPDPSGGGISRAPRAGWESGGPQTQGASRAELRCTEAPPESALLTAPRVFLPAPTATEFGESVRTRRAPPPWLAQPCSWSPPPRHLSDGRLGARPTRKGLGEGAPLVSTCDGELNFSFTRCRGNAGGGDEWAGRGTLRVNQLRRRPRGVPALARRCLGSAQRAWGPPAPEAQGGAAPEWMNCPTLSGVDSCLPLHSPTYLDLHLTPLRAPESHPSLAAHTGQLLRSSLAGNSASGRQKASPQLQPPLPFP